MMTPFHGTKTDFIKRESRVWGEDVVDNLLDGGYDAVYTTAGWKWILPLTVKVDKEGGYPKTVAVGDSQHRDQ